MLFGFSAGVTVLSMGWLLGKLRPRWGDSLLGVLFAGAMLIEVGLITMQTWRGIPSHFNQDSPLVLAWIEGLIFFATLVIIDFTIRCFGPMSVSRDMRLAIQGGMALLLFACLFGFLMVAHGNAQLAKGAAPGRYGQAGVMKFPHGMPIHAIQYLPILAWVGRQFEIDEDTRHRGIAYILASLVCFTLYSLMQTFGGRARFDVTPWSAAVLVLSAGLLVIPLLTAARAHRSADPA